MTCFQIGPVELRSISLHGRITFFVCHLNGLFIHLFGEYFDMVNKSEKGYHLSKYN